VIAALIWWVTTVCWTVVSRSWTRLQAHGVAGQGVAVQGEHVAHHGGGVGGVVGLQDDLHGDRHVMLLFGCGEPSEGAVEGAAVEALQTEQRCQAGQLLATTPTVANLLSRS